MAGSGLRSALSASRRGLLGGLAAVGLAPAAYAQTPADRAAHLQVDRERFPGTDWIPMDMRDGLIRLAGAVNDHPTRFWLDSGAAAIVLDQGFAREVGVTATTTAFTAVGLTKRTSAQVSGPLKLTLGGGDMNYSAALIDDLSSVSSADGHRLTLMLGRPIFDISVVDIDFPKNRIAFRHWVNFQPAPNAVVVPLRESEFGGKRLQVSIEGRAPIWATLDLGNGGELALSGAYAKRIGLLEGRKKSRWLSAGVEGIYSYDVTTIGQLGFPGVQVHAVPTDVLDSWTIKDADANLGLEVIRQLGRVMIDFPGNRMFILPSEEQPTPFERDRAGLALKPDGDHMTVLLVAPGSPAERAGWKLGEQVGAIDGIRAPIKTKPGRGPAGAIVHYTMADGSERTLTLADYF